MLVWRNESVRLYIGVYLPDSGKYNQTGALFALPSEGNLIYSAGKLLAEGLAVHLKAFLFRPFSCSISSSDPNYISEQCIRSCMANNLGNIEQ